MTAGGKRPLFFVAGKFKKSQNRDGFGSSLWLRRGCKQKKYKKIVKNNCGWGKVIIPFDCGWFFDEYLDANEYEILEKNPLEKK